MRHRKRIKKLNKPSDERKTLLKNMGTSLILYEQIKTTNARAKALVPFVEHLITIGKQKDEVKARRELLKFTFDKNAVEKIVKELKPKYKTRTGGYTKIHKIGSRTGDSAPMVSIKLT